MSRRVGPVPLTCQLRVLRQFGGPGAVVGVWVRAPARCRRMIIRSGLGAGAFLISADLRQLLLHAHHVLVWDGVRLRRLPGGAHPPKPTKPTKRSAVAPYA